MINKLKEVFGMGPAVDYKELTKNGAVIVDVRSQAEFSGGHITGAQNIPLPNIKELPKKLKDKNQPIITCCASGMRSASAKNQLKSMGYTNVHNGGGWNSLQQKLN